MNGGFVSVEAKCRACPWTFEAIRERGTWYTGDPIETHVAVYHHVVDVEEKTLGANA